MVGKGKIEKNLRKVRENIEAACTRVKRAANDVTLVGVTKSAELDEIKTLVELGVTDLGEGRVQQLAERSAELTNALAKRKGEQIVPRWHMIGHLQRNKVKAVLEAGVGIIHSVDSLRLAEEIDERAAKLDRTVEILLEVNCSQESQKFGVAVGAAQYLAEMVSTLKNVRMVGLMTMAPQVADPQDARATFVRLRELFEDIRHDAQAGKHFKHLSMGMSQDYTVAVEEGATLLRIGSALFE